MRISTTVSTDCFYAIFAALADPTRCAFFFYWSGDHRDLHSFPTRRSSDLTREDSGVAVPGSVQIPAGGLVFFDGDTVRSEEHTSELQSQSNLVCRLLLEKKNGSARPEAG